MEQSHRDLVSAAEAHPLFHGLSQPQVKSLLQQLKQVTMTQQTYLIREGDQDKLCYLVLEGELEVVKKDASEQEHRLASMKAGDVVGAIVLLDDKTRSASVRCLTDCVLLCIEQDTIEELIQTDPAYYKIFKNIGSVVSHKLRETNEKTIQAFQEKIATYQVQVAMSKTMIGIILALSFLSFFNLIASKYVDQVANTTYITAPLMVFLTLFLIFVIKIVKLPFADYGLRLTGAKRAILGSMAYSLPLCVVAVLIKWALVHYSPEFAGKAIFQLHHGRYRGNVWFWLESAAIYALVICPFQECMSRCGLQAPLQHLFVGSHRTLLAIV